MDHQDVPSSSATQPQREEHVNVIQVLDTPATVQPSSRQELLGLCGNAVLCVLVTLALLFSAFIAYTIALHALYDGPIDYSAALTSAAAAAGPTNTIPALFNLTVHIKDSSRLSAACVPCGTTAAVSYDGGGGATVIGAATAVPAFCAGEMEEQEVVVPVWGMGAGADLTLPSALQRRDAVVDVVIRMPGGQVCRNRKYIAQVLTCAVRVGRGLSPCTSECGH